MKLRCPKCNEESDLTDFQKHYDQGELDQIKAELSTPDLNLGAEKLEHEIDELKRELNEARDEAKAAESKASQSDLMITRIGKKSAEVTRAATPTNPELKGEAAEIELAKRLSRRFGSDRIEDVPKGAPGADFVQTIKSNSGQDIARVIVESKTGYKSLQSKWITKLSRNINGHEGNVGVLVSDVFPAAVGNVPLYQSPDDDRIWVSHPDIAMVAINIIRDGLIKEHRQKTITKHATETTKDLIYEYMTGDFVNQLKLQMKVKLDMEAALEKEKTAYLSKLKARKTQLDLLTSSIVDIVGVVSAIGLPNIEIEKIADL